MNDDLKESLRLQKGISEDLRVSTRSGKDHALFSQSELQELLDQIEAEARANTEQIWMADNLPKWLMIAYNKSGNVSYPVARRRATNLIREAIDGRLTEIRFLYNGQGDIDGFDFTMFVDRGHGSPSSNDPLGDFLQTEGTDELGDFLGAGDDPSSRDLRPSEPLNWHAPSPYAYDAGVGPVYELDQDTDHLGLTGDPDNAGNVGSYDAKQHKIEGIWVCGEYNTYGDEDSGLKEGDWVIQLMMDDGSVIWRRGFATEEEAKQHVAEILRRGAADLGGYEVA